MEPSHCKTIQYAVHSPIYCPKNYFISIVTNSYNLEKNLNVSEWIYYCSFVCQILMGFFRGVWKTQFEMAHWLLNIQLKVLVRRQFWFHLFVSDIFSFLIFIVFFLLLFSPFILHPSPQSLYCCSHPWGFSPFWSIPPPLTSVLCLTAYSLSMSLSQFCLLVQFVH